MATSNFFNTSSPITVSTLTANSNVVTNGCVVSNIADTAPTLTTTQMINGLIFGAPTTGRNITTPTATAIVAAIPNCAVNASFEFLIRNESGGANSYTLVAGDGVTLKSGNTNTVAQANTKRFRCVVTGVSTPAVTIYSLGTSAH